MLGERAQSEEFLRLARVLAYSNEALACGFDPSTLREVLIEIGLDLAEDLSGQQLVERYDSAGANGMRCANTSHIALARGPFPPRPASP